MNEAILIYDEDAYMRMSYTRQQSEIHNVHILLCRFTDKTKMCQTHIECKD